MVMVSQPGNVQPFFCTYKSETIIIMKTTTIHRTRPVKPTKEAPVQHSGIADQKGALSILHDFYMEAKKEIKGATKVSLHKDSTTANLSFMADGFILELNFTEGRKAV